jgi:hypothetical protein
MPVAEPDTDATASSEAVTTEPDASEERAPAWGRVDSALALVAAAGAVLVHPVHAMLSQEYWLDEAWVADATRVPWSRVHAVALTTPLGFSALIRLVPGSGLQRARLVVLVFAVLAVVAAYVFTRLLAWSSSWRARFAACVAALVVMLVPLTLGRNDLKQYTSDAFCALVVLTVAAVVDRAPGRPVWWLSVTAVVLLPFSSASAFVSVAAFAGLLGSALIARSRRRSVEVLVNGAIAGIVVAAYYGTLVIPQTNDALHAYWRGYYLTGMPWDMVRIGWDRLSALEHWFAIPAWLLIGLVVVGLVALARLRAHAVVIAVVVLWVEMAVVARARLYPFLDQRTSHFLLVPTLVVAAIGFAALVQLVYRWWYPAAVVLTIVGAVAFFAGARHHIDKLNIPVENAREQADYVAANAKPTDVVVVNNAGSYAFAYYWPGGLTTRLDQSVGAGFDTSAKHLNAVYAPGRSNQQVLATLTTAVARWRAAPAGSRLYIVRSHVSSGEARAWKLAFEELGLHPANPSSNGQTPLILGPS